MDKNTHQDSVQPIIIIRKKHRQEEHAHSTAWKIALADFMTTLMIVFFVMWIVNLVPPDKKKQLVSFFQGKTEMKQSGSQGLLPNPVKEKQADPIQMKIYYALEPELKKIDPSLRIYLSRGRLEINLRSNILFETGKADIKPQFALIIKKIVEITQSKPVFIDVYGYTDNIPIHGGSNLLLSMRRAEMTAKEFIQDGISDKRMGIHGEGDRFPVATNDTDEGRSFNRRIVIYISPMNAKTLEQEFLTALGTKASSAPNQPAHDQQHTEVTQSPVVEPNKTAATPSQVPTVPPIPVHNDKLVVDTKSSI